ncbi:MAG: hypothetical protein AAB459_04080 [Patescibacteria group bacterium]
MVKARSVAYGDIDISKGEGLKEAKIQLDSFVSYAPIALYFDVIGKPGDEEMGEVLVAQIRAYAGKIYSAIHESDINCTFMTD